MQNNLEKRRCSQTTNINFKDFKLKKKPKKMSEKVEQLCKEAEIFILKSKKVKFTQDDLSRFLRDMEIRQELSAIEESKNKHLDSIIQQKVLSMTS